MPRLIPRARKWQPDELVRPLEPFSCDHEGAPVTMNPSDRLRGGHPLVKRLPHMFVRAESSDAEVSEALAEVRAATPVVRHEPLVRLPPAIPPGEAAVAIETFTAHGRYIARGQRLRRDDRIVRENPTLFQSAPEPLA